MANARSWTGVGIGLGVAAAGGGLLWYLTRSGKAAASPFTTAPPSPPPPSTDQPMGGPPPPPVKPGILTVSMNGDVFTIDGVRASADQVVEAAKAAVGAVEIHHYLVDKVLWQAVKTRLDQAGVKWNLVSVVSIGGLMRVGTRGLNGRGHYG